MAEETKPPEIEAPQLAQRGPDGKFLPGAPGSRNGGRRKLSEAAVTMLGDAQVPAIQALIAALEAERSFIVGEGDGARLETAPDHDARIKAANSLLDRWGGKPAQAVTGEDGGAVQVGVIVLPPETDE